jgi:hypothetical protein
MPRDELPRPQSTAPPRAGSTCVYLSSCALTVRLSRLPGRLKGEPSGCGIVEVFVGISLTLRLRCPSIPRISRCHPTVLDQHQPVGRPGP